MFEKKKEMRASALYCTARFEGVRLDLSHQFVYESLRVPKQGVRSVAEDMRPMTTGDRRKFTQQ
jgi:hypothetical protein